MKNAYKFSQPIVLGPASSDPSGAANGAVYYNTAEQKFKVYENGAWKAIVTGSVDLSGYLKADGSVPLTANWNVGGFKLTNLAAPVVASDAANKQYVDAQISAAMGTINYPVGSVNGKTGIVVLGAIDIGYSNVASGLVATTVQAAIDEVESRVDAAELAISNHISNATDAHDASAISNVPSGNLAATNVQSALNELQSDVDSRILSSEKGAANGVATLDVGGKVPASQLPSTLMEYLGVWNASTNTPTLADGAGGIGNVYRVSVAGTQNLGSGAISFEVGDYVIYNGAVWEKSDTTDAVASVNGKQGIVTLTTSDINEGTNLYYTDARAKAAAVVNTLAGNETDKAPSVSVFNQTVGNVAGLPLNPVGDGVFAFSNAVLTQLSTASGLSVDAVVIKTTNGLAPKMSNSSPVNIDAAASYITVSGTQHFFSAATGTTTDFALSGRDWVISGSGYFNLIGADYRLDIGSGGIQFTQFLPSYNSRYVPLTTPYIVATQGGPAIPHPVNTVASIALLDSQVLKKDGSVPMTGDLSLGNNNINNVQILTATNANINFLNSGNTQRQPSFSGISAAAPSTIAGSEMPANLYDGFEITYTMNNPATGEKRIGTFRAVWSATNGISYSNTFTETSDLGVVLTAEYNGSTIKAVATATSDVYMKSVITAFRTF